MKRTTLTALLLLLVIASTPAKPVRNRTRELISGEPIQAQLPVIGSNGGSMEFTIEIPDDIYSLDIQISNSPADLDIFLFSGQGDLAAYSEYTDYNERLYLSRVTDIPVETTRYTVEINYQYSRPPVVDNHQLTEIPFTLTATTTPAFAQARVAPGESIQGELRPETGMMAAYEVPIPTGTSALRIDISDTDGDVDLFVTRDYLPADPFEADYWAQSVRSTEELIITRESIPSLRPGTYYVMVIDQIADDYSIPFTLTASESEEAPESLWNDMTLPTPANDFDRAILATVEVLTENSGGSGCIISPDGYLLTNFHVVRDEAGEATPLVTIAFSIDERVPPQELFRAEVVDTDEEHDIALLKIISGRYGEPLPADFSFPTIPLGVTADMEGTTSLGDELHFFGYPWIGGTGSRASITYTHGVVSGYQQMPDGYFIKTDGEINEGNSGGAALNAALELVGLPTQVVGVDGGQLAYVVPVDTMPRSWYRYLPR